MELCLHLHKLETSLTQSQDQSCDVQHKEDALSDHQSIGKLINGALHAAAGILTWDPLTGSLSCPAGQTFQKWSKLQLTLTY